MNINDIFSALRLAKSHNYNFVIKTSIAVGKGINGTDYTDFIACGIREREGSEERIISISVLESSLMIDHSKTGAYGYHQVTFLPFDKVACINVIMSSKIPFQSKGTPAVEFVGVD